MTALGLSLYSIVCTLAIIVNIFIIVASLRPNIRGEFKWVFFGAASTNLLLSISQLVIMPRETKWPENEDLSLILSSNPLLAGISTEWCDHLYSILYFRQLEAGVLSVCIVPLNRAVAVCWKHLAPTNAKWWIIVAALPICLPLLAYAATFYLPVTGTPELKNFSALALQKLNDDAICTVSSSHSKSGDLTRTIIFLLCPFISYPVAVYCVAKLFFFVRNSQQNVRSSVSKQVLHRQKSILVAICIQSVVPLLTYLPLFLSILLPDSVAPSNQLIGNNQWFDMSAVHYAVAFSPFLDAVATVICLKPYRRALLDRCGSGNAVNPPTNIFFSQRDSSPKVNNKRDPSDTRTSVTFMTSVLPMEDKPSQISIGESFSETAVGSYDHTLLKRDETRDTDVVVTDEEDDNLSIHNYTETQV